MTYVLIIGAILEGPEPSVLVPSITNVSKADNSSLVYMSHRRLSVH